jgi:hypothetical protein
MKLNLRHSEPIYRTSSTHNQPPPTHGAHVTAGLPDRSGHFDLLDAAERLRLAGALEMPPSIRWHRPSTTGARELGELPPLESFASIQGPRCTPGVLGIDATGHAAAAGRVSWLASWAHRWTTSSKLLIRQWALGTVTVGLHALPHPGGNDLEPGPVQRPRHRSRLIDYSRAVPAVLDSLDDPADLTLRPLTAGATCSCR